MDRRITLGQAREGFTRIKAWTLRPYYDWRIRRSIGGVVEKIGQIENYTVEEKAELRSEFLRATKELIAESQRFNRPLP